MGDESADTGASDTRTHRSRQGEVHHDAARSRYEWRTASPAANAGASGAAGAGNAPPAAAFLEYTLEPDPSNDRGRNRMIFTHTFVPPEMRGAGIAEKLVRAALADAHSHGRHVVPECTYVARFIERHLAEYGELVNR